ncbi:MAG: metallopeptidase family protein [Prosthecobacter sp.]|nr:metallopeptidase family protein [Prosthecobacter sp.]
MHPARLLRIANHEVGRVLGQLPDAIHEAATACRVECVLMAECLADGESLEDDLLGLFEGCSRADPQAETADQLPRIRLFLDNLWDYAGANLRTFRAEVRLTLLHELGHYLGLSEAGVEQLGLA